MSKQPLAKRFPGNLLIALSANLVILPPSDLHNRDAVCFGYLTPPSGGGCCGV
jgi:hypothetical protein